MTLVLIFVTVLVSILCFRSRKLFDALALDPWAVWHKRQWYRVVTHGFVHADVMHLLVNMFVLYSFGSVVETWFKAMERGGVLGNATLTFLLLYFGGMLAGTVYDLIKRRNTLHYLSVGASGAVCAVIFCSIFLSPLNKLLFFGIIPIPAIIFGVLYLLYERYMAGRQKDNVNHYAHLFGALFGFIFPLLIDPMLIHTFFDGFSK